MKNTIKESQLKSLVKIIIQEVKRKKSSNSVKMSDSKKDMTENMMDEEEMEEHRGAKGTKVGQIRTKKNPMGTSGNATPKGHIQGNAHARNLDNDDEINTDIDTPEDIEDTNWEHMEDVVKHFVDSSRSAGVLIDFADQIGLHIPGNMSRFDVSEVASFILNRLFRENKKTGEIEIDKKRIERGFDYLVLTNRDEPRPKIKDVDDFRAFDDEESPDDIDVDAILAEPLSDYPDEDDSENTDDDTLYENDDNVITQPHSEPAKDPYQAPPLSEGIRSIIRSVIQEVKTKKKTVTKNKFPLKKKSEPMKKRVVTKKK